METFSALLAISAGNPPVPGEFPAQRPVTRRFGVFFDLRLINGWVNNGQAGDLRRHRANYDVIVVPYNQKPTFLTLLAPFVRMNQPVRVDTPNRGPVVRSFDDSYMKKNFT